MKHWIPLCLALVLLLPYTLWSVSKYKLTLDSIPNGLSSTKMAWLDTLSESIHQHNLVLHADWQKAYDMLGDSASQWQNSTWILNKMHRYGLWQNGVIPEITDSNLTELLKRMAPVPAGIVLAQSIISSDWGQTEQAKLANNLFNVVCFNPDCGMLDKDLPAHSQWKIFNTKDQAIERFVSVDVNKDRFASFRDQRFKMLQRGTLMSGSWYHSTLPTNINKTIAEYHLDYWDRLNLKKSSPI